MNPDITQKACLTLLFGAALVIQAPADTIAQWNFNSVTPDATSTTGSTAPVVGAGTVAMVGGATNIFSSGNNSTDPATADDTAFHTSNYPPQNTGNKTRGVQFNVSTLGYESLVVTWDEQHSASASRYFRFQYSLDGVNFVDHDVITTDVAVTFLNGRTVSLNSILGANDNANFAFRLVAEFQDTATSSGASAYVATGAGSYSQGGTARFDMMTVSGSILDPNAFPTITGIANQTTRVDTATAELPFQIGDAETPAANLTVTGASSNPALVPPEGIIFGGSESNRTVSVSPNFDAIGTTTITITVRDEGGKTASTSFTVTVLPNNTAPTMSTFTNYHTVASTSFAPISFTIGDSEDAGSALTVTAASSNQELIAGGGLMIGGSDNNRTLTITPAAGKSGVSIITVTVTDSGGLTNIQSFNAMVVPSSSVLLTEPYDYIDGPLTLHSARLWTTRAGTLNQMQVAGGVVHVTGSQDEDVVARLIGGPYGTGSGTVLYASFDITFSVLPDAAPDIFAHFSGVNANDLRARVLSGTQNAAAGFFRLGVANTTSVAANVVDYPLDLSLETTYQVIVSHDVTAGTSKLWVNPGSGGAAVAAIDAVQPTPINAYGLRQSTRIGAMRINNLLVGLSFEAVTPNLMHLKIIRNGTDVEISWSLAATAEGYEFESTLGLNPPNWQRAPYTPNISDDRNIVSITNPANNEFFRLKKP